MGFVYYGTKDWQNAIDYYKKAIESNSEIAEIYLHLAQALEKNKQK